MNIIPNLMENHWKLRYWFPAWIARCTLPLPPILLLANGRSVHARARAARAARAEQPAACSEPCRDSTPSARHGAHALHCASTRRRTESYAPPLFTATWLTHTRNAPLPLTDGSTVRSCAFRDAWIIAPRARSRQASSHTAPSCAGRTRLRSSSECIYFPVCMYSTPTYPVRTD